MSDLTIKEHVERAAAFVGLIKKHEADLSAIGSDIPKAISIAQDFHDLFAAQAALVTAPAPPTATQFVAPAKTTQFVIPATTTHHETPAPKVTAHAAAEHVATNGLTVAERAAFDRASQSIG